MPTLALRCCACVSIICFLFAQYVFGDKQVTFTIDNQTFDCSSDKETHHVEQNELLTVFIQGYLVNEVSCSIAGSTKDLAVFNITEANKTAIAKIRNPTEHHNGTWKCTVLIKKDKATINMIKKSGHNYTAVSCSVQIFVPAISTDNNTVNNSSGSAELILGLEKTQFYIIIGCVVGVLVVIVIIAQSCIIVYYKSRIGGRSRLSNLERPPPPRDDTARYSTNPLRKDSRRKRQSSGIYQSLENLRTESPIAKTPPPSNIRNRKPMPLPIFCDSDDDSQIYGDGSTLSRMFTPEPPPLDSLPRRKKGKFKPKPAAKPTQVQDDQEMFDYDYADNEGPASLHKNLFLPELKQKSKPEMVVRKEILQRPVRKESPQRMMRNESPQKTMPRVIAAKPTCGTAPVVNELDNIFKKRNQNARAPEKVSETPPVASHTSHRQPVHKDLTIPQQKPSLKGPPEREVRPNAWVPPNRAVVDPRSAHSLRAQPRPLGDSRASEASRPPDIRPQNVRLAERFEGQAPRPPFAKRTPDLVRAPQTAMVSPMQLKSPPLPRKPGQASDGKPPVPGLKKPLPPPPCQADMDDLYEPVAEGESSDDDEWKMEKLTPYNIYNV